LGHFWNILFYGGCFHFLARIALYFDQKKTPPWLSGQTKDLTIIQKLQRDSFYNYTCYVNRQLGLNISSFIILLIPQLKSAFCSSFNEFWFFKGAFFIASSFCGFLNS